MKTLTVKLYTRPYYSKREEVEILVELINDTARPVYVAKNIAGAFENQQKETGKRTSATTKSKSRSAYYKIRPKSSIIKKANLGQRFSGTAGLQELAVKIANLEPHYKKSGNTGTITRLRVKSVKLAVQIGKPVNTFFKEKSSPELATPDASRLLESLPEAAEALPPGAEPARDCIVNGGSPSQVDTAREAHEEGYTLAFNALSKLRNDATYRRWFGIHTSGRFDKVTGVLKQVIQDFQDRTFTYNIDNSAGKGDVIANAQFGDFGINLFSGFFDLLTVGGRMFHEHTHASGNTLDHSHEENDCLKLALDSPDKAVENANSFRFFAEA